MEDKKNEEEKKEETGKKKYFGLNPIGKGRKINHLANAASIGTSFALCILIGGYMGYWLDNKFHTYPWCLVIFLALGFAAGVKNMFYFLKRSGIYD